MVLPASDKKNRSKNRSTRSAPRRDVPTHLVRNWTTAKIVLVGTATMILASTTIYPMILLERSRTDPNALNQADASIHKLVQKSEELERQVKSKGVSLLQKAKGALHLRNPSEKIVPHEVHQEELHKSPKQLDEKYLNQGKIFDSNLRAKDNNSRKKEDDRQPAITTSKVKKQQLARGVSGLPMSQTPALIGAQSGHVECDVDVDDIVYWNDPQGKRDREFVSPFKTPENYYLSFQPDLGGWNNIRMSMEIIFVLATVTGRTLVLPPKAPFYLLGTGAKNAKSFGNFYNMDNPEFKERLNVITMSEFLEREGTGILGLSEQEVETLKPVADMCLHQVGSDINCDKIYAHLKRTGFQPDMGASQGQDCLVFDEGYFNGEPVTEDAEERAKRFCGPERKLHYYDNSLHSPQLIHWDASDAHVHRLLNHFYAFIFFTNPVIDNYYKRFVRDFLHYKDEIYCAAGKIVHAINDLGKTWSTLHVRRGDLQYKKVKISAEEWYENSKEFWEPGELIFIATDERNKTFFDPIKEHHELRFLDDYWDMARLGDLDKNFLGMIDTIVASHGRTFSGTWFSTFTGYINRMRGYLGYSMKDSWYSWNERREVMHDYQYPSGNYGAREWPLGWVAIDGDEVIEHEGEPVVEESADAPAAGRTRNVILTPLEELQTDESFKGKALSRGLAGRPMAETPALEGASRAHIDCDINVDSLAYWNDPQGKRDEDFESPFKSQGKEKYITFTTDRGGWNNVRMSMETIFVVAAATGRTIVLPPKEPLYRLHADKANKHRGFADFFPLHTAEFQKRVKIITMEEFVKREGGPDGVAPIPEAMRKGVLASAEHCDKMKASPSACAHIAEYLAEVGFVPDARAKDYCLIFDKDVYNNQELSEENKMSIEEFCGDKRKQYFWTSEIAEHPLIHFRAGDKEWRLLVHFYNFHHFTDPAVGNYFKRFVRDFLHYHDSIYCAAGKIVKALQAEGMHRGFDVDENGAGGFSAMHIRRGDFQYKKVKIPAEEWYENTKEVWKPKEIIYIATDERNKTFFDPIAEHSDIRFLDDYFDYANLGDLDPNYFGMIDTIVSSRARAFAGTWFSTFTGYINRMRGYHGMTMKDSWYSYLERKTKLHEWSTPSGFAYAYEWPDAWIDIDTDVLPTKDKF